MSAEFDPKISLGHILTAVAMLLTMAVGWGVHSTTVAMLQSNDSTHDRMIEMHTASIRALELNAQKSSVSLDYIKQGVEELKRRIP